MSSYTCDFCSKSFTLKKTLKFHIENSKKCISTRSSQSIYCMWCSSPFQHRNMLERHYKECQTNKEIVYSNLLEKYKNKDEEHKKYIEEYKEIIKDKENQIKELQSGLFKLANKTSTTINNSIYNVNLVCDKPLVLTSERVLNILVSKCNKRHILNGEYGIAELIVNHICRNDLGNLCIECTDVKRKNLRYIDELGVQQTVSMNDFISIIKGHLMKFRKHTVYKNIVNELREESWNEATAGSSKFFKPGKECKKYIIERTYKDSPNQLLTYNLSN